MTKIYHLSHLLDEKGYNRIDLISFYNLSKLDEYIENFANTGEVRKKYEMDISEFCLDNREMIQKENKKNKRNWTGTIAIICEEKGTDNKKGQLFKIPIIYKNDKKLLPKKECIKKIKEKLKNEKLMLEIFDRKSELLSQNERELVMLYQRTLQSHYLSSAIGFFVNRLRRMEDDELLYLYCRDLMHICELNVLSVKTKFGEINNINENIPEKTVLEKKSGFSKDVYFNKLIDDENYDELFRNYDLDEIIRDSDMYDKEGKKK